MSDHTSLGPGAEFDAIRALLARWGPRARAIGDDAAILSVARGDALVVSVDCAVEGRHFRPGWLCPREVGYRAVAAALSDLAAMASTPVGVLISLIMPTAWLSHIDELADGIGEAVDLGNTHVVGGNMSGGSDLSITTTVLGSTFLPLPRGGAREGNSIYVTGMIGGAGAALADLESGAPTIRFRDRFARPTPRLREARWLAAHSATAAIDVSDGLAADLTHLAAASGRTLVVDADAIPCVDGVSLRDALESGEEYELVVTASEAFDVAEFMRRFGVPLTRIGRVTAGPPRVEWHGASVAKVHGHDHFSI